METTDRRQIVRVEAWTGAIVKKNPEFLSVGRAKSQNSIFSRF